MLAAGAAALNGIPHVEFDRLGLRAASSSEGLPAPFVMLDELRLGETWESVTPVIPEPAALTGLILAAVVRQRVLKRRQAAESTAGERGTQRVPLSGV